MSPRHRISIVSVFLALALLAGCASLPASMRPKPGDPPAFISDIGFKPALELTKEPRGADMAYRVTALEGDTVVAHQFVCHNTRALRLTAYLAQGRSYVAHKDWGDTTTDLDSMLRVGLPPKFQVGTRFLVVPECRTHSRRDTTISSAGRIVHRDELNPAEQVELRRIETELRSRSR